MQLIRVGAGVLNQTPLDWDGNRERILAAIAEARQQRVSVLCLPEMCITGYNCEDAYHSPWVAETALELLHDIAPACAGMIVSLGLPVLHRNALFNCACLLAEGRILGFVAKQHLASEGIHYEPRWFKPWPAGERAEIKTGGLAYPLGDLIFDCGGVSIGFEICEDAWAARRPGASLSRRGLDVLLNPSASHFAFGKLEVRKRFVLEGSRAFGVSYVYSNLLGNEAGRAIYDGGALIAAAGELKAVGPRLRFADHVVTSAVIDVSTTRAARVRSGSFTPQVADHDGQRVAAEFDFPELEPEHCEPQLAAWETSPHCRNEAFTRAVALGLHDYLRKSHASGFVVSLSGGADSAAVACLVATMVRLGVAELGIEAFTARLGSKPEPGTTIDDLVHSLLTCAYQATVNSSDTTRAAARQVAEALGADFHQLDVEKLVQGYVDMISEAVGRELEWQRDDVALQNIQARVRAPGVWLLANLRNALLLATSNRSEAAVGYATMDGDTCGGLSPIAGVGKPYLRQWLRWLETEGPDGMGPIPVLAAVNAQQPTAELRPSGDAQTDEGDLMPYELLDAIEVAAIRDKHPPLEVFRLMRIEFPDYPGEQLAEWVERFFRLFARNQWKRERYAPSFHLDDTNLDPKTWCRFPILSGGFERGLEELRKYVMEKKGDR
jgi:NAD+ synthase (glutamine-hydrolysing)